MDLLSTAPAGILNRLAGQPYTADTIGLSGAGVLLFPNCVLKTAPADAVTRREIRMMTWLQGRLPVPEVLHSCEEKGRSWLLMSRLPGQMACDPVLLSRPDILLAGLCQALQALWQVNTRDCPISFTLDEQLMLAEQRVRQDKIDPEDADPATFGPGGFRDPAHLLSWLKDHRPPLDPVLSHGDLCLPNILLEQGRLSGFIDLGLCTVGDRWRDLALCWRSLRDNTHGHYGDFLAFPPPDSLFSALQITPDREKLRYYLLLDELF